MKMLVAVAALLGIAANAQAQRPLRHVLYDFETGIDGWWGNVYQGAGTCKPKAMEDAKFGAQAIHCDVNGVEGGSNTVSPWLPKEADWRQHEWSVVSLWVRGDGSRGAARFIIETGLDGEPDHQTYTINLPLDSKEWRPIRRSLGSFWNRYKVPMDSAKIGRVMFGCSGTHQFDIDHIVLEAPNRPVPMEMVEPPTGVAANATLAHFADGPFLLRFDPTSLGPNVTVNAVLRAGDETHRAEQKLGDGRPSDEVVLTWDGLAANKAAEVKLSATAADGRVVSRATYRFDLVTHQDSPDPTVLDLVPAPKECTLGDGSFGLSEGTVWQAIGGISGSCGPAVNLLTDELTSWQGKAPTVSRGGPIPQTQPIALVAGSPPPLPAGLRTRRNALPAEGYVLHASPAGVRLAARDPRGLVNAVCTLLQAIESHFAQTFEIAVPAMTVVDWPSLPIRAINIPLPTNRWGHPNDAPVDPDFFIDFLRKTIVRQKLNMVCFIVQQAMQYESNPKVAGPAAWDKETVKRIFDTMRRYAVEPVPECNSLGHANWLAIPYKELAEDGDEHQFCTSNPETKRILLELYQEIIDLVQPKYFHIGMDEIRWKTHALPEDQRCQLCAGKDKRELFVEWTTMLHEFFTKQGIEVMMWGDMLVPEHNGRAPYNLSDTIDRLPKDLLLCNWSTNLAHASSHWFRQHGFERVIKSNSRGATLQEGKWCVGNMMGTWIKTPWLVEGTDPKLRQYTYLSHLECGEFSWNWWPDLFSPGVPLKNEFFQERPLLQWRVAADPVPGGAPKPIPLPKGNRAEGASGGEVRFGGLRFDVAPDRVMSPAPGESASVSIGKPVAALYFLHGAELNDRDAMVEALKASTAWEGIHLGAYEIEYASGKKATVPIRYPMELRDPEAKWCTVPVAYRALGVSPDAVDSDAMHLYALQWVNARPAEAVTTVTLRAVAAPAAPLLAGLVAQPAAAK